MQPLRIATVEDLVHVLDEHPHWLEAVRSRLLTRELLELPQKLAEFAADTERRFETLERRLEALEHRFETLERRLEALERRFETRWSVNSTSSAPTLLPSRPPTPGTRPGTKPI